MSGVQTLRVSRARTIVRSGDGREAAMPPNPFDAPQSAGDCEPLFFLDGIQFFLLHLDQEIDPNQVEGVEVYTGTRVPPQFGGSRAACGVIAIWTRERAGAGSAPASVAADSASTPVATTP